MKGLTLSAKTYPGILMDISFDDKGDLDRESYMTKIVNGKQVVTDILAPLNKK
jgi:branched-chain amino acid transport system substrate-binding protein